MHRLIMQPSPDMVVDHINGDGLDNKRENLRIVTHGQNIRNSSKFRSFFNGDIEKLKKALEWEDN